MSVIINTNSAATVAANNLAASNALLQRSLNRLSSGSKIVNPADDAGGLAVSMKFSAVAKRQGAAASNIANSVSFLQTQDGVLKVAGKVMERIGELKTLAADPTKNLSDIANYNAEFTQLQTQLTSLGSEKFNGTDLFGTELSVPTNEDGTNPITMAAIALLGTAAGTPTTINLTLGATQQFTPTGAGTLTVTSGDLDFTVTGNTFLNTGQSATYDGAGNWTLPAGLNPVTGTTIDISTLNASTAVATFTVSGTTSNTGSVAAAASLSAVSLSTITSATADIATHRANNGALQSRLGFAAEILGVNKANLEAANSRITDVDVAEESTQLARYNILVQAGTSMLAQANQSAQSALRLIS